VGEGPRANALDERRSAMAIERREPGSRWPDLFTSRFFDRFWPFEDWRSEDDQIKVDEFMDGGQLVVRADLPGVDPDHDIEITVQEGKLHIQGHRRQETKTEDKNVWRSEVRYGSFTRTLPLPTGTGEKDITANYKDGVLEVRLPVDQEKAAASRIPISRS
jgi:HSP20 family protein